jgi:hypothetical protein
MAIQILQREIPGMPREVEESIHELLLDPNRLMGFMFVQETTNEDGSRYEGINISLGRVNTKRYRDRLDIIIESQIVDERSQGASRLRVYVDPYDKDRKPPLWTYQSDTIEDSTREQFEDLAALSWEWADHPERVWSHWTSKYIEYFGPRQWNPLRTYFFHSNYPETRIPTTTPDWAREIESKQAC